MTIIDTDAPAAGVAEVPSFTVTFIIRRFDPEKDAEPYWQDFDVEMFATDRVLPPMLEVLGA